ncbi:MAG: hypothetical protein V3S68_05515 [Dehalococcoidia bacterium]
MSPTDPGELNSQSIIGYILQQEGRFPQANLFRYNKDYLGIDSAILTRCVSYMASEELITVTSSLGGELYIEGLDALSSPLEQGVREQLALWYRSPPPTSSEQPQPRGPGAPLGNMNALKDGRYSKMLIKFRGIDPDDLNDDLTLTKELRLTRAMLDELSERDDPPIDLILRGIAMVGRLVVQQLKIDGKIL